MRFYLAAQFDRRAEMRAYRDVLHSRGDIVTSRWIDVDNAPSGGLGTEVLNPDPAAGIIPAVNNLDDIAAADILISFTGQGGRGGRHTEFGYAVALGRGLILIGKREHVFHCLPQVTCHDSWDEFITGWAA